MPYALRSFTCPDCRKPHSGRYPAGTVQRCHPCRIGRAAEAARQMHAKSGPFYERWVWAHASAATRMLREMTGDRQRRAA